MYKVAYNACYGGFSLSKEAIEMMAELGLSEAKEAILNPSFKKHPYMSCDSLPRHNSILIQVIETLGDRASGICSNLRIAKIDSKSYKIKEYDGLESIQTNDEEEWYHINDD
jgi:hypothetical protein